MTISSSQAAEFLAAHDQYLILTHVRPDGDTVGCAAALAREFAVSRQIIVGDIALLRAAGADISATPSAPWASPPMSCPIRSSPPCSPPIWRASWPRKIFFRTRWSLWTSPPGACSRTMPCPISPG